MSMSDLDLMRRSRLRDTEEYFSGFEIVQSHSEPRHVYIAPGEILTGRELLLSARLLPAGARRLQRRFPVLSVKRSTHLVSLCSPSPPMSITNLKSSKRTMRLPPLLLPYFPADPR